MDIFLFVSFVLLVDFVLEVMKFVLGFIGFCQIDIGIFGIHASKFLRLGKSKQLSNLKDKSKQKLQNRYLEVFKQDIK